MVKKNMTIEVSFPGIEKKPAPMRSLANFIAENSSLYFKKYSSGESTGEGYTISNISFNYYDATLTLNGDWEDVVKQVFVCGNLIYNGNTYEIGKAYECSSGEVVVNVAELIPLKVEAEDFSGWDSLIVVDAINCLCENNGDGTVSVTLDEPFNDYTGTIFLFGTLYGTSEEIEIIANSYEFTNGQCELTTDISDGFEADLIAANTTITPADTHLSGNIRFDNMIVPYDFEGPECYDISALYGKSTAGSKIAAQSEDHECIHGFKMVAARPGSNGNNLVAVFSPYSGDGTIQFALYNTVNEELIFIEEFYPLGNDDYLNQMSCYINDEYHSVNEYIRFVYTSPFEYNDVTYKWGILDLEHDTLLDDNVVVHFTGGSNSVDNSSNTPATEVIDSATEFVIDCDTYLCKTNSTLAVRNWVMYSENSYDADVSEVDNFIKLPVTITPKINGKVNTDKSVVPSDSLFNNWAGVCAIPLSGKVGKYDIQLRTPTFTLCEYDIESDDFVSDYDVYYKVGVVPFDGLEETRDKIVKHLSGQCINFYYDLQEELFKLSIGLISAGWQDNSYSVLPLDNSNIEASKNYTRWCSVLDLENYVNNAPLDYTNFSEWVPKSMCLTLFDNSMLELKGLAYFRLCNGSDGSPFNVELQKPYYVCLKQTEDEITQPYNSSIDMFMTFTDEKLDGGFVRACNMNFGLEMDPDWQQ